MNFEWLRLAVTLLKLFDPALEAGDFLTEAGVFQARR